MFRLTVISLIALVSLSAFAQENSVDGFNSRFNLVRNAEGKVTVIKLKRATRFFTIKPFIEQIKNDLKNSDYSKPEINDKQDDNKLKIKIPKSLAQNIKNYNL